MSQEPLDYPDPLHRYWVLDFGWVLAGALPGMALTDLGAQLIKVETRQRLDYMRMGRPIIGTQRYPEQNPMFHNVNRSKLSIRPEHQPLRGGGAGAALQRRHRHHGV